MAWHRTMSCLTALWLGMPVLSADPPRMAGSADDVSERGTTVENMAAFARLYGYVRFFHPSDEAASLDWDRMAILGARRVQAAATSQDLRDALEKLFAPVAPTLRIYTEGSVRPRPGEARVSCPDRGRCDLVAWQHYGIGLAPWSFYSSTRTNRPGMSGGMELTRIIQGMPAAALRGQHVRLRAAVRAEVEPGQGTARLSLMVSRAGALGLADEMADRPITDPEWRVYEIRGRVDDDAAGLLVGMGFWGSGQAWYDAFELEASPDGHEWTPVPLQNPDMAAGDDGTIAAWNHFTFGGHPPYHEFQASNASPYRGATSALLRVDQPDRLFDEIPEQGEFLDAPIGLGLRLRMPLVLPSVAGRTVPAADPRRLRALREALKMIDPGAMTLDDQPLRLATVAIGWSILQHFYPYTEEVELEWADALRVTLADALEARDPLEHLRALQRMMARLEDGHARVDHPVLTRRRPLPIAIDKVEDRLVVVAAATDTALIRPGDEVVAINGTPAGDLLRDAMAHASGSEGLRRAVGLATMTLGEPAAVSRVRVRTEDREHTVHLRRGPSVSPGPERPPAVAALTDGVFYVDLTRIGIAGLGPRIDDLASAHGIVFDVRGYPAAGAFEVLLHLADRPVAWNNTCVHTTIRPDRDPPPACAPLNQDVRHDPLEPRFRARAVFMTGPSAVSYGDLVMSVVKHYRLGDIVGQPTGGANGNQAGVILPGGIQLAWTGMHARHLDGSRNHAIGVLPSIPAARTIQGIREGRDEVLEAALATLGLPAGRADAALPLPGHHSKR